MLAIQGIGIQAVAMAGVLQCGTLQLQRGACGGRGCGRQQGPGQCSRCGRAEALVGECTQAARSHRALGVSRVFRFGVGGQLDHTQHLGGCRRVDELGVAELDLRDVHVGETRISGQQQHRRSRFFHDRIGLAVSGEQRAVSQVQAESAQRIGGGTVVADGHVQRVIAHGLAAEGRDPFDLAWERGQVARRYECRGRQADLGDQNSIGAGVRRIDQLGEAGVGDFQSHAGFTLRSVGCGGRPWRVRLQARRLLRRPACLG
ncbi:hypothetical protein D3C81_1378710 [compost metagenome]